MSTFGGQLRTPEKQNVNAASTEDQSIMSEMTMDSRISRIENGYGKMEKLLTQLLANQSHKPSAEEGVAQPTVGNNTNTAESMEVDSAAKA